MHKRRANFDPLKFTPSIIHNKKALDNNKLIDYFKNHSLSECARQFNCSKITIKRRLRLLGVGTNTHSMKGSDILTKFGKQRSKLAELTKEKLIELYLTKNIDTITIAEMYNVCKSSIRVLIQKYGLTKNRENIANSMSARHYLKYSTRWPAQRPEIIKKTLRSATKTILNLDDKKYYFKSLHELAFALYCHYNKYEFYYEEMCIPYVDMLTGKSRVYIIDFTVIVNDEVNWVEIKPKESMIPIDKRIYAERRAEEAGVIYRGHEKREMDKGFELFASGYLSTCIEFVVSKRINKSKQTIYSKINEFESTLGHLKLKKIDSIGIYYKAIYGV